MDDEFVKDFMKVIGVLWFVLVVFLVVSLLNGCNAGWSIAGWEVK